MKALSIIATFLAIFTTTQVIANGGNIDKAEDSNKSLNSFYFSNHQLLTNDVTAISSLDDLAELEATLEKLKVEFKDFPANHPVKTSVDKDIQALENYISTVAMNFDVQTGDQLSINVPK